MRCSQRRRSSTHLAVQTLVVYQTRRPHILFLGIRTKGLCENDQTLPGNLVLLDELAEDDFRFSRGVYIGRVECLR